jgi:hypothetical protein
MGDMSSKPKTSTGAILRRRRGAVAAFRREKRSDVSVGVDDGARDVPGWGRIVFRSGVTTLR